ASAHKATQRRSKVPEVEPIGEPAEPTRVRVEKLDKGDERSAVEQLEAAARAKSRARGRTPIPAETLRLLEVLTAAVKEAAPHRSGKRPWPVAVQQMAVQLVQAGASRAQLESTG